MASVCICDTCGQTLYSDHREDGDRDYCSPICMIIDNARGMHDDYYFRKLINENIELSWKPNPSLTAHQTSDQHKGGQE